MTPDEKAQLLHQSSLQRLLKRLTFNSLKINEKYSKIGSLPPVESCSPSLLRKFTRWIEQIGGLQEKEKKIISEITSIEEKHRLMRKACKLRRAEPQKEEPAPEPEEKPKGGFWKWFFYFLLLSSAMKKQDTPKNG